MKDGEEDIEFVELFYRKTDRVTFHADKLTCAGRQFEGVDVAVSETAVEVNGETIEIETATPLQAATQRVIIPREALSEKEAPHVEVVKLNPGEEYTNSK